MFSRYINQKCLFNSQGLVWSIVALAALLSVPSAWAQSSSSGTISGQVTDQSGSLIVGVDVKITDPSTNIAAKTQTNNAGRYILTNVSPHTYIVEFSKTGFTTRRIAEAIVQVGQTLTLDAVLEVGQVTSVVEVTAQRARNCKP